MKQIVAGIEPGTDYSPRAAKDTVDDGIHSRRLAAKAAQSGLLLDGMDPDVRPGDDFNAFANGGWMKATEIPADKATYGIFYMLHEESQERVRSHYRRIGGG